MKNWIERLQNEIFVVEIDFRSKNKKQQKKTVQYSSSIYTEMLNEHWLSEDTSERAEKERLNDAFTLFHNKSEEKKNIYHNVWTALSDEMSFSTCLIIHLIIYLVWL